MKSRNGFVSNSSTTSFTCEICGDECGGQDLGLNEAEMICCLNQHYMDIGCIPKNLKDDEFETLLEEDSYEIPTKYCPICQFHVMSNDTTVYYQYLLKRIGISAEDLRHELKNTFTSYEVFLKSLEDKEEQKGGTTP
jgi:hypothetical protein